MGSLRVLILRFLIEKIILWIPNIDVVQSKVFLDSVLGTLLEDEIFLHPKIF
jgi:hypothetical protein